MPEIKRCNFPALSPYRNSVLPGIHCFHPPSYNWCLAARHGLPDEASLITPGPACHAGILQMLLMPPPLAFSFPLFHVASDPYAFPIVFVSVVPPTPVT